MKNKIMIALTVLVIIFAGILVGVNTITKNNEVLAIEIRNKMLDTTFEGKNRVYETVDKGGPIKLSAFTETNIVGRISNRGYIEWKKTEVYCDGFAIISGGEMIYDDADSKMKEYEMGEVEISLLGDVKVWIGNKQCSVVVDDVGEPVQIEVEGVQCDIKQ